MRESTTRSWSLDKDTFSSQMKTAVPDGPPDSNVVRI